MKNSAVNSFVSETLPRLLFGLVVVGLAFYAALTLWLAFSAIFFPYLLDYGEGDVLWFTRQVAQGQPIYIPLGESFTTSNYPPVFYLLAAALDGVFGASYGWGRFLGFASTLIITSFVIRFVRAETHSLRAAFLAGLFFFGSTFVYHWTPLFRIDLPGVAFTLAGVFCVWRWESVASRQSPVASRRMAKGQWLIGFAILFFLLALYTKHSLVVAPIAAALAIFLRERRAGIFFAVALGGIGGAIFLLMEALTRGGWSFGLLAANATVWTPRVFFPLVTSFVVTYAVLLGLGAWGWSARVLRKQIGILEIYAAAALISIGLAGREGAWENYFLEVIAMVCVFAGIAIARFPRATRTRWLLPALLLLQLFLFWNEHDPRIAQNLFTQTRAANEAVAPLIRKTDGVIISEDMGLLITNGKPVTYYSFPYSTLARAGKWDQHWEIENLRAGNFPLVILKQGTRADVEQFGNFTRAFVSALDYAYAVIWQDAHYQVYAPAPLEFFEPRATFGDVFELVGWAAAPPELRAGEEMTLTLVWRARQKPPTRFTAFAHLEDANGGVIAQDDHEPQRGAYPTTLWAQDEMVRDTFQLKIPANLKPGPYSLRVGWYDSDSQDRLSNNDGADFVELKKFGVP